MEPSDQPDHPPPSPTPPLPALANVPVPPPLPPWAFATPPYIPAPPPRRIWPVFTGYGIYFGGMLAIVTIAVIISLAASGVFRAGMSQGDIDAGIDAAISSPNVSLAVFFCIALLGSGIAVCGAMLSPRPFRDRLALGPSRAGWGATLLLILATLALSHGTSMLVIVLGIEMTEAMRTMSQTLLNLSGWQIAAALVAIALGAGVGEELFFRGYMQTRLVERLGIVPALLITSALFGFIHLDLLQSPFAFAMGLLVGWAAYRSGSIRPAIAAHVINNAAVVLMAVTLGDDATVFDGSGRRVALVTLIVCAAVLGACVLILNWILPRPAPPPPPPLAHAVPAQVVAP